MCTAHAQVMLDTVENCPNQLESFLRELIKGVLRWPKHFSNTAAVSALEMGSMRCRLVVRKFGLLRRQLADSAIGVGATYIHEITG